MFTEIEAKLKVDNLHEVEERLSKIGGKFVEDRLEKDWYFDNDFGEMVKNDKALRLRVTESGSARKCYLTYKGAREKASLKQRCEIEVALSDEVAMEKLLEQLDYQRKLYVEKQRKLWKYEGCEICLDRVRELGNFVEIEGPNEEVIVSVQQQIGLEDIEHIPESYACLIVRKKNDSSD